MKVAFAHNVHDRFKTLTETINAERKFFPESDVFVAANSYVNDIAFHQQKNMTLKYFLETPQHKIGCTNGMMITCNMALEKEFDVLIFSHDDVRLKPEYFDVVMNHINSVFNNEYDIVYRNPGWLGDDIAMMEIVYMNRKAVETLFSNIVLLKDESEIGYYVCGKTNSISPEFWFYNRVKNTNLNSRVIKFGVDNGERDDEEICRDMGYFHINNGIRGWKD